MAAGLRLLALNGLLMLLYIVLGRITFAASVEYGNVTGVVFVPEGVALAFTILFGARVAPGIFLGQTLLSYWSGPSLLGGLGIGVFNALECVLGGYLFHRWHLSRNFDRPRDVALFAFMILFILQPISATGGVLVLLASGMIPADAGIWFGQTVHGLQKPLPSIDFVPSAWVHWWIGNAVGQLLVSPLCIAWLTPRKRKAQPFSGGELAVIAAGTCTVVLLSHSSLALSPILLLALGYALLVWIGVRRGVRATTAANMLIAAVVIWMGSRGDGFMSHLSVLDRLSYVSFFVATSVLASLALFAMFEERRDLINRLTEMACKDVLTQVSNRRYFIEQAERELALAQRHGHPVSLALLDVDYFKVINDRYGHPLGDEVLVMIARRCEEALPPGCAVGRIGGEEFALLFPRADAWEAYRVTEQLRRTVECEAVRSEDGTDVRATFSAGIVESTPTSSLLEMFRTADEVLYQAKNAGRNQVQARFPLPYAEPLAESRPA